MPTARDKKQDAKNAIEKNLQNEYETQEIAIEKNKLCVEKWKLVASIIVPILATALAAWIASESINKQLEAQARLKNDEFQSQLFVMAIQKEDSNALLRKLIHTGALDDSKGKYSFLVDDTVHIIAPKYIEYGDTATNIREKNLSRWAIGHTKDLCGGVEATNFNSFIYSNGVIRVSFDVKPNSSLKGLVVIVNVCDSSERRLETIRMPEISIPPLKISGSKRVVYEAYSKTIRQEFDKIGWTFTDWDCN